VEISASLVKELRALTGAGVIDCRNALAECEGDLQKAQMLLRAKGLAAAASKSGRVAKEGLITSYIHGEGRLGVLVEVNCETDFVARTQEFKTLARDIALQIAATDPRYVSRQDVPPDAVASERAAALTQAQVEEKSEADAQALAERHLTEFYETAVLLDQPFIRSDGTHPRTVADLIKEVIAKTGENIQVRRFARFRLGEG